METVLPEASSRCSSVGYRAKQPKSSKAGGWPGSEPLQTLPGLCLLGPAEVWAGQGREAKRLCNGHICPRGPNGFPGVSALMAP